MKYIEWNAEKNELFKIERNVSFEDVIEAIFSDNLLDDIKHPNRGKYANQRMFIVNINDYVYLVPYLEDSEKIFLKSIFPSRKATKKYLKERSFL